MASGRVWRYSLPFAAIGGVETLLLAHFRTAAGGDFDLAYRLPQTVLSSSWQWWSLVMAGMSEAYARDRRLRSVVERCYRLLFRCAPPCAAACLGRAVVGGLW
jgi:hypothetical protein